jgi:replicative DNA helicase
MPQAGDSEESLLAALLNYGELLPTIENNLRPDDFYHEANRNIFAAACGLDARRDPVNTTTIIETLRKNGTLETSGGAANIIRLTTATCDATGFQYFANVIKQKSIARKIIHAAAEIQALAFDETQDVADIIETLEKALTDINTSLATCESIDMPEAIKQAIDKAAQTQLDRQAGKLTAIPTGLAALDREFAGGWRAPDLVIIGARPSMGKTQHALSFAKAAAISGKHVMFASLEMTPVQLVNRYFLEDERISPYNLRTGQMSDEEWNAIDHQAGKMWNMKLHITNNTDRQLSNIKSEARRLKRKGELELLIIDYLQLIKTGMKFGTRDLEIGHITGEMKNMAKELDIPVIVLAQLNRKERGVKAAEPHLEDLRESGNIEQDADIVLLIHKPDYHDPLAQDAAGRPWKGRGKLIIAKYREGVRNRDIIFHHDNRYKKIYDAPGNFRPVDFSEPEEEEGLPF